MANHSFEVTTSRVMTNVYDISITPSSSAGSPITLTEGDTVTFKWVSSVAGAAPSHINFSNISANTFTGSSLATLYSVGSSFTRTVKTGGTLPNADSCRVSASGSGFHYWYLYRVSSIDTLPNAFDLGPVVVNANPSQVYYSKVVTITGINTNVGASCNNGGLVRKNNGAYVSSTTVNNGDTIQVKQTASAAYGATLTTTLTVGGTTDTFVITNKGDPGAGEIIYLGINSGEIKLSQIGNLFGRPQYVAQTKLSDYLKAPAGVRVPDIAANSNVPAGYPIKLTDFYGSATSFYISTYPNNKALDYDTTSSGGTFYLWWEVGDDWFLGFHPDVANVAEYKYSFTETGYNTGISISSDATWNVWSNLNRSVQLGVTVPTYVERRYSGQLTIYARHPLAPTKVVSATVNYWFDFYGP